MGRVFEDMCREAYRSHHARWGLAGAHTWGRWVGQDRARRSIELDVVADLDDATVLTGEFKWAKKEVDLEVHLH